MVSRLQPQDAEGLSGSDFFAAADSPACAADRGCGHSPEVQLLLACARTTIDGVTAARIKSLLLGNINWTTLVDKTRKNGVMPLLFRSLESTFPELVPLEVMDPLRGSFQRNALNNLVRTRELLSILQKLASKDIPALSFKGPLLAIQAYGHLELRQFGDLDILVHKRDVFRIKDLLFADGYRLAIPLPWISRVMPALSPGKDLIFLHDKKNIVIELHWRLTGRHFDLPIDMKGLWRRLVPVSFAGSTVKSLPLEDLLLYLCMHGARHSWERLSWICDVAELIRLNQDTDWNGLMDQAAKLGSERMLALGLLLASDLLGASLPPDISARIQSEPKVKLVAERVRELLFQEEDTKLDISYWFQHHLLMRERFSDRTRLYLHYCRRYLRIAVTPNERDHERYLPPFFSFLYYMLRPVRLVREYGVPSEKSLLGRILRRPGSRK